MSSDYLKFKFIFKIVWIFDTIILYTIYDGFVFLISNSYDFHLFFVA